MDSIEIKRFTKVLDIEAVLAVIVAVAISGRIAFDCKLPKKSNYTGLNNIGLILI